MVVTVCGGIVAVAVEEGEQFYCLGRERSTAIVTVRQSRADALMSRRLVVLRFHLYQCDPRFGYVVFDQFDRKGVVYALIRLGELKLKDTNTHETISANDF